MTRRSKILLVVAALFTLANLGGAGIAAVRGEGIHTAVHVVLLLLGAYWIRRLVPRARGQELPRGHPVEGRLEQLQQSVDAIALEVERIGEAQRFSVKLQKERGETHR